LRQFLTKRVIDLEFVEIGEDRIGQVDCHILKTGGQSMLGCGKHDYLIRLATIALPGELHRWVTYEFSSVGFNESLSSDLFSCREELSRLTQL
jgi:hypothetical protein